MEALTAANPDAEREASHRERLRTDPRLGVTAFTLIHLLDWNVRDVAKMLQCDSTILQRHLTDRAADYQRLLSLPAAMICAEMKRQAA